MSAALMPAWALSTPINNNNFVDESLRRSGYRTNARAVLIVA